MWVGSPDAPALRQLQLEHSCAAWSVLDPRLLNKRQLATGPPAADSSMATAGVKASQHAAAPDNGTAMAEASAGAPETAAAALSAANDADSKAWQHGVDPGLQRTLQRRYYLVEKVLAIWYIHAQHEGSTISQPEASCII